jgi:hypothetical protein
LYTVRTVRMCRYCTYSSVIKLKYVHSTEPLRSIRIDLAKSMEAFNALQVADEVKSFPTIDMPKPSPALTKRNVFSDKVSRVDNYKLYLQYLTMIHSYHSSIHHNITA